MATITDVFGEDTLQNTGANLATGLSGSDIYLAIKWNNIKTFLSSSASETPNSAEDWLAAILYAAKDYANNSIPNNRRFSVIRGNITIDNGFYLPNVQLVGRETRITFYSPSDLDDAPNAGDF